MITYSSNNYERITGKMQLSPYDGWGILKYPIIVVIIRISIESKY